MKHSCPEPKRRSRMLRQLKRTYGLRNQNLRILGFSSYKVYLESDLWKSIRTKVLSLAKHTCQVCKNAQATQVHHLDYGMDCLEGKDLTSLVAICSACHNEIEFTRDGLKRGVSSARMSTRRRMKNVEDPIAEDLDRELDQIILEV